MIEQDNCGYLIRQTTTLDINNGAIQLELDDSDLYLNLLQSQALFRGYSAMIHEEESEGREQLTVYATDINGGKLCITTKEDRYPLICPNEQCGEPLTLDDAVSCSVSGDYSDDISATVTPDGRMLSSGRVPSDEYVMSLSCNACGWEL